MSRFTRSTILALAVGLPLALPTAVSAAPAQHDVYQESFSGSQPMTAEENPCGDWAGSFTEVRSGSYKILTPPGGQVDGEFHVNGAVNGSIELIPTDPALPSYSGTYREKVSSIFVGYDEAEGDDIARVGRWALRTVLRGTDGSRLVLSLGGKITMNANGVVVVDRRVETCG